MKNVKKLVVSLLFLTLAVAAAPVMAEKSDEVISSESNAILDLAAHQGSSFHFSKPEQAPRDCPPGSTWNSAAGICEVQAPFKLEGQTAHQDCPPGSTWNSAAGICEVQAP